MARNTKVGIDYFSHDVDMLQDKKIKLIKAKHGLIGYAIFLRLLEDIYRNEGYYLKIDDDFNILFADENNIDINVYINVLNDCINKGLFDKNKYNEYNIITSKRIQENYFNATLRRKKIDLIKEFLILSEEEVLEHYDNKRVNVNINRINANIKKQSKVKESKVNKSNKQHSSFGDDSKDKTDDKKNKKKNQKNMEIYIYWQNKKGLHEHKYLTKKIKKQLNKVSKKHVSDIKKAIDRYHKALIDDGFYYQHHWTLNKFLKQSNGYPAWLDEGNMWVDYMNRKKKPKFKETSNKNNFHNFEYRGNNYSEDELEKILGIKDR